MYSSYLSSITSKVSSIRQNLLQSEADGDTPDDTHLCRVLRTYYTDEKRVALPPWLPPDPRAPPPLVVQPVYSQPGVGASYGLPSQPGQQAGGLSSLWSAQPPAQQAGNNGSLRSRPGTAGQRPNPFAQQQLEVAPRPLPSQKAGSYQGIYNRNDAASPIPPGSAGSAGGPMTAAQRLKAKVNRKSPSMTDMGTTGAGANVRANSYDSSIARPNTGGGSYEDRFMPSGNGGGGGSERPFMAATSPWASNESEFGGGGYIPPAPSSSRSRPQGLPSGGPGGARRAPGLPGGGPRGGGR